MALLAAVSGGESYYPRRSSEDRDHPKPWYLSAHQQLILIDSSVCKGISMHWVRSLLGCPWNFSIFLWGLGSVIPRERRPPLDFPRRPKGDLSPARSALGNHPRLFRARLGAHLAGTNSDPTFTLSCLLSFSVSVSHSFCLSLSFSLSHFHTSFLLPLF